MSRAILALAAFSACPSCASASRAAGTSGRVFHVVVLWLKNPGDKAARERLIRVSRTFAQIPGVLRVDAGSALPSARSVADSTFDMAVVITFADKLAAYLNHSRHKKAAREHLAPLTRKVVVYDFEQPVPR